MIRPTRTLLTAALLAAVSCTDLFGPEPPPAVTVSLALTRDPGSVAFDESGEPIARIRLTARRASDKSSLGSKTIAAAASTDQWNVDYGFTPPSDSAPVIVTAELLGASGAAALWSGMTVSFVPGPSLADTPIRISMYPGPLDNLGVITLSVTPNGQGVDEGATISLTANIIASSPGAVIYWKSLDPGTATVSNRGVVTGVARGAARIVAAAGQHADTAHINVLPRVASIVVSPGTQTLSSFGATAAFTARAFDQGGAEVPGVVFTYSVSPASVASLAGTSTVRAEGNGQATLSASARGVVGTASITVAQQPVSVIVSPSIVLIPEVGESTLLAARVRDANGHTINNKPVVWTSSSPGVASVNAGIVTANASGIASITATAVGSSAAGSATVTVGAATLLSDGFENGFNWLGSTLANRARGGLITNAAHPQYVTSSGSPLLPNAPQGQFYLWFGYPATGNYLGPQAPADGAGSGGTSRDPQFGVASSPPFTIPAGAGDVYLSFRSWFEIEGVRPDEYDRMRAAVIDVGTGQVVASRLLNTGLSSNGNPRLPRTSAGGSAPPVFVTEVLQFSGVDGRTLRVEFSFDTEDEEYNGFRGWIIDDVRVTTAPPASSPER